ncbi:MAG: hypothetical protein GX088_02625 [Clostridia bacterium]|nr:hypothetical protein [Clostridia bacterium]
MSPIEIILLILVICLLLLVFMALVGAIFLVRLIITINGEVKALKTSFDKEFLPVINEVGAVLGSVRELIDTFKNSVGNLAFMFMAGKGAPKLLRSIAGFKMGLDLAIKLYNQFYKKNNKRK